MMKRDDVCLIFRHTTQSRRFNGSVISKRIHFRTLVEIAKFFYDFRAVQFLLKLTQINFIYNRF